MADYVAGDTNSVLVVICKTQAGVPIDLTNRTATLRWRYDPNGAMVKMVTMLAGDQTEVPGQCYRRWLAGELVSPTIIYDVVITEDSDGRLVTQVDEDTLFIRARAEDPDISSSPSSSRSPSSSPSRSPSASPSPSASASRSPSSSPSSSGSASPSSSASRSPSSSPSAS